MVNGLSNAVEFIEHLWQKTSVETIVDFNSDGKVDRLGRGLLMVNWGTDDSRYDIGPTPCGDGMVDSKDLMVFACIFHTCHDEASSGSVLTGRWDRRLLVSYLRKSPLAPVGQTDFFRESNILKKDSFIFVKKNIFSLVI